MCTPRYGDIQGLHGAFLGHLKIITPRACVRDKVIGRVVVVVVVVVVSRKIAISGGLGT